MRRLIISLCMVMGVSMPVTAQSLDPNVQVIQVQSGDAAYRVSVLEEQVRQLNGKIEELTFQLLELQEQLRRTQEDNDYRLRELEDKQGNLGGSSAGENLASNSGDAGLGKQEPSGPGSDATSSDGNQASVPQVEKPKQTLDGVELYSGEPGVEPAGSETLGIIQFDENGNVIDTELGKPLDLGGTRLSSVLPTNPDDLFALGFESVQIGRYEDAERAFTTFSETYSAHPRLPEARFWLGESYLGRKDFQAAAKVYLDAHKRWPDSKYGPQSLLKLGVSVAGLNQRELACATFAEVQTKYPDASRAIKRSVAYEQKAARCNVN